MSLRDESSAIRLRDALNEAGYAADIETADVDGNAWVRIRVKGFASRQDVQSFATRINNRYGIQRPWIVKF